MYKISKENRDALIVFLQKLPYEQVVTGIQMLLELEEIVEEKEVKE